MPAKAKGAHHRGDFDRRSRQIRAAAVANPLTRCAKCGLTARKGDPWEAGHAVPGDPRSPLRAEHRSCNRAEGARITNAKRQPKPNTSRRW